MVYELRIKKGDPVAGKTGSWNKTLSELET
jgi:hypothetical protein